MESGRLLPKDIIFVLPTNWLDSKKKFEDSLACATSVGHHAYKALLCRQSSSAQADQNILQSDIISTAKGSCEGSSGGKSNQYVKGMLQHAAMTSLHLKNIPLTKLTPVVRSFSSFWKALSHLV